MSLKFPEYKKALTLVAVVSLSNIYSSGSLSSPSDTRMQPMLGNNQPVNVQYLDGCLH